MKIVLFKIEGNAPKAKARLRKLSWSNYHKAGHLVALSGEKSLEDIKAALTKNNDESFALYGAPVDMDNQIQFHA